MENTNFVEEQFRALRREILSRQARMFWTAVIGLPTPCNKPRKRNFT